VSGQAGDLPVPKQRAFARAKVFDHAELRALAKKRPAVLPSTLSTVSALGSSTYAAQYPDGHFAPSLTAEHARLAANVDRFSFNAVDFHHLLSAGLPAHRQTTLTLTECRSISNSTYCMSDTFGRVSRQTEHSEYIYRFSKSSTSQ
jgi:hypothetical protein